MSLTIAATTASMNRMYRRQRHIYDVTRKYYLLGRDAAIARLQPAPGSSVLEIGCGTGRNLVRAAERYPDALFFGVDVSTAMLTSARGAIGRAGLDGRVRVAHGDATAFEPTLPFQRAQFDRILISYSLSMIPHWETALDRALELLAPGGALHVVDFGDQRRLPAWFRAGLRHWLALFEVAPRDGLAGALAVRAAQVGADLTVEPIYSGYAQFAVVTKPGAAGA